MCDLSGGGGVLSGDGLTANPDDTYTLAASDSWTVTAELDALSFTPNAPAPGSQSTTAFTLNDQSSAGFSRPHPVLGWDPTVEG